MHIQGLGQLSVTVSDLGRATRFYRDTLGLTYLFSAPNMAFFDCGGVRLMLGLTDKKGLTGHSSILYFKVDDIRAAHRELANKDVLTEGEPHIVTKLPDHDLWMAFFRDTEDNLLALMHEARH